MTTSLHTYQQLCQWIGGETLPAMLVDLEAFDRNVKRFVDIARACRLTLRPATKSIRVPALIRRIADQGGDAIRGLMCYSVAEAEFLAEQGCDDLLVAYPHVQSDDARRAGELADRGKTITLMIDSLAHIDRLARFCRDQNHSTQLRVCIDVDASLERFGQHFGAQRSPIRSIDRLGELIRAVKQHSELNLVGAMTYEAQVAGIGDTSPHQRLINPVIRWIKAESMNWLAEYRRQIRAAFADEQIEMEIFNGGGSGSLGLSATHQALTEVTAGSGFLQSHLFDHYADNRCEAALLFALPITRIPQANRVTCHSGGFIASGATGMDKQPTVYQPSALQPDDREGFGEVQTPLIVPSEWQGELNIADPVFFRPAKAGEIAERFHDYCLVSQGEIVERVKTYRGFGKCFF